jgi:NAD(P)-dependent dehydrogenase (short-subunit alcohol dehydrogenase family)
MWAVGVSFRRPRHTKAALNVVIEGLTHELSPKGIGVLILHPGWVRTRMGGEGTSLMPPESVRGMRSLVVAFSVMMAWKCRGKGIKLDENSLFRSQSIGPICQARVRRLPRS